MPGYDPARVGTDQPLLFSFGCLPTFARVSPVLLESRRALNSVRENISDEPLMCRAGSLRPLAGSRCAWNES